MSVYATLRLFPWVLEIEEVVRMEEDGMKVRLDEPRHVQYRRFSCRAEIALVLPYIFHQNAKHIRLLNFMQFHTVISGSTAVTDGIQGSLLSRDVKVYYNFKFL